MSTSNNKYDPPRRSSPKLTFFDKKKLFFSSTKFVKEKNDKNNIIVYIVTNFNLEKYNTKYNYFFVLVLLNKFCTVDLITVTVTLSEINKSTLSSS